MISRNSIGDQTGRVETDIEYLTDAIAMVCLSDLDELLDLAQELVARVEELQALHGLWRHSGGQ